MHISSDPSYTAASGARAQSSYTVCLLVPVRGRMSEFWSTGFWVVASASMLRLYLYLVS